MRILRRVGVAKATAVAAGLWAVLAMPARGADDLAGVWRCETQMHGYPAMVETVLQANGSFTVMMQNQVGFMSRHWGTYEVGDGFIRFVYEGHEPRQFCGPLGCQDLAMPEAETVHYQILEDGRLATRSSVCMVEPCGCVSVRVQ